MEIKKINGLILVIFTLYVAVSLVLGFYPEMFEIGVILNLSLGEILLGIPTVVYLLFWKMSCRRKREILPTGEEVWESEDCSLAKRLHFNRVKGSTVLYAMLFTWLSMPLTTLLNVISMLFVDNTVMALTDMIYEVAFPLMLFLMAVVPAVCEEVVFRGVVYGGYRKSGNKFVAVLLSGLLFGIMHMNLNQALYAFAIGVLLALLLEATNSIWVTMLFHFIYNAQSCCLMFLVEEMMPGYYSDPANTMPAPQQLYTMIAVYIIIAAVTTPLAICLLYKIAKNENRVEQLKETLPGKGLQKEKLVTISLVLAIIVAFAFIVFDILLSAGIITIPQ